MVFEITTKSIGGQSSKKHTPEISRRIPNRSHHEKVFSSGLTAFNHTTKSKLAGSRQTEVLPYVVHSKPEKVLARSLFIRDEGSNQENQSAQQKEQSLASNTAATVKISTYHQHHQITRRHSPRRKRDASLSLFQISRRGKRSPQKHRLQKNSKNSFFNRPISFFKHSPPTLDVQNADQIKYEAQNKPIKMPLTLIFSHRRHMSSSTSNNINTIASGLSDDIPVFSSRFESGNLQQVWMDAAGEFYLFLESDKGSFNSLWFHFFMSNLRLGARVVLNICNISNRANNFAPGFQPCMRVGLDSKYWLSAAPDIGAAQKATSTSLTGGWKRFGQKCVYFKTGPELKKRARILLGQHKAQRTRKLFTLRFEFTVTKELERALCSPRSGIFIAFSYPYTYSDLCRHLARLERDINKRTVKLRIDTLCFTVHGREAKILTISSAKNSGKQPKHCSKGNVVAPQGHIPEKRSSKKPIIFISARVHAGEVSGSHTVSGILDYLCLSTTQEARTLRANFIFKIIPMLSIDAVIDGCQRNSPTNSTKSSDEGVNLNEIYDVANKKQHPTIYAAKRVVKKLAESREITLLLDLHGHYNSNLGHFMYGYTNENNVGDTSLPIYQFPRYVESECQKAANGQNVFVHKEEFVRSNSNRKAGVGPVFFSAEQGIENAFTVESCMHNCDNHQFTPLDYYNFGRAICNAMFKTFESTFEIG